MFYSVAIGVPFGRDAIPFGYYRLIDNYGNFVTDNLGNVLIARK